MLENCLILDDMWVPRTIYLAGAAQIGPGDWSTRGSERRGPTSRPGDTWTPRGVDRDEIERLSFGRSFCLFSGRPLFRFQVE